MANLSDKLDIAVVGGGVAGITAAFQLQKIHAVTLLEANDYVGGHTNTLVIPDGPRCRNAGGHRFYRSQRSHLSDFESLFERLNVGIRESDMSFSYFSERTGFQYGSRNFNTLFAQRKNLVDPLYWKMLGEILRFNRRVEKGLHGRQMGTVTLGQFLQQHGYSRRFQRHYVFPMVAAIWSAPDEKVAQLPMLTFARFFHNHGLLSVFGQPQWYHVAGGSQTYVRAFLEKFNGRVETGADIAAIERTPKGVVLRDSRGEGRRFDRVVIATHADQALKLLKDPFDEEVRLLSPWRYSVNETYLHTDTRLMPTHRRAWASWNFIREAGAGPEAPVTLTYHMNRLQNLKTRYDYLVTLNPFKPIDSGKIIAHITYTHPTFTFDSLNTQRQLLRLNGLRHTVFCGSYFGYGFHEDARPLRCSGGRRPGGCPMNSKLYKGFVDHERFFPKRHHLRYNLYVYAFDLAELEKLDRYLPLFGYNRFRPVSLHDVDYLDDGPGSIHEKLLGWLKPHLDVTAIARVIMVTSPRLMGYIFNPVSFYYCFDASGGLPAVVAEVNNTYGEKHIYPLPATEGNLHDFPARFQADKAFHVSPYNTMGGRYDFSFSDVRRELNIRLDLHREGEHILRAELRANSRPLTPWNHLKTLLRHPFMPLLTIPRIYWEAFKLRFKRKLNFYDKPVPISPMTIRRLPPTLIQKYFQRLIQDLLGRANRDQLQLTLPDGRMQSYGRLSASKQVRMRVNDYRFFSRVALGGDIGLGEAFMYDEWDTDDITGVLRFFIRNRAALSDGNLKEGLLQKFLEKLRFLARANTLVGSRRNIHAHYDLSNDFFQTFLDDTMAYSCAVFEHPDQDLKVAQLNKFHRIIKKLRLQPKDHLLEIGCGWGGFAIEAVRRTGCRGDRDHHLRRAIPTGTGAGPSRGPGRPYRNSFSGLPENDGMFSQDCLYRDVGGGGACLLCDLFQAN